MAQADLDNVDAALDAMIEAQFVRQLRHHLGPFLTLFSRYFQHYASLCARCNVLYAC